MRRELVMLAHEYKGQNVKNWLYSEKMDGIRGLWDGGISRGIPKREIPWANNDRDDRYITAPIATGLWTRYGNVLHAPDSLLDQLPPFPLDGELFSGRKEWQTLSTVVKRIVPDGYSWRRVTYNVFDTPSYQAMFEPGMINNPNFRIEIDTEACMSFVRSRMAGKLPRHRNFVQATDFLLQQTFGPNVKHVKQTAIGSLEDIPLILREVNDLGGEGVILRDPKSYWTPKRSHCLLKLKEENDDEGTVIGYFWGRETDRGSKFLGMMGAVLVDFRGVELKVSGFTDAEREMTYLRELDSGAYEGQACPGRMVSDNWTNTQFPIGSTITFKYRELSDGGVPQRMSLLEKA